MMHKNLQLDNLEEARLLFGNKDRHLHRIRERFGVRVYTRNGLIRVEGEEPEVLDAVALLEELLSDIRNGGSLSDEELEVRLRDDASAEAQSPRGGGAGVGAGNGAGKNPRAGTASAGSMKAGSGSAGSGSAGSGSAGAARAGADSERDSDRQRGGRGGDSAAAGRRSGGGSMSGSGERRSSAGGVAHGDGTPGTPMGRGMRVERSMIHPRTEGQRRYVDAVNDSPIVFCIGPAGTGKTYLSVALALIELGRGTVGRIVLARPAVEAGETLGFLPGDFQAKIHPYLRPLYDALFSMVDSTKMRRYMEKEMIEIVPLAYMRGRTLDNAFIILDEAQNTTPKQMKMFLTRMGQNARIVVTGDITQIDLPKGVPSGLVEARRILDGVGGVTFVDLETADIVRHPIVQNIVDAFAESEAREEAANDSTRESGDDSTSN